MDPMTVAALVRGTGTLVDNAMSYFGQRQTNKRNEELAEAERRFMLEMWNRQNAYNTPKAQMQRFKAAGLNPNLIYEKATSGGASSVGGYSRANVENPLKEFNAFTGIGDTVSDALIKSQQLKNLKAEESILKSRSLGNMIENAQKSFDYGLSKELRSTVVEQKNEALKGLKLQNDVRQIEKRLKEKLSPVSVDRAKAELSEAYLKNGILGLKKQMQKIKARETAKNPGLLFTNDLVKALLYSTAMEIGVTDVVGISDIIKSFYKMYKSLNP